VTYFILYGFPDHGKLKRKWYVGLMCPDKCKGLADVME
jgi:hypothetical protein